MRNLVKKLVIFLFSKIPLQQKRETIILMYHSISNSRAFFAVKPEIFEKQIRFLKENNFNFIHLSELIKKIKEETLSENTICITFDDGYIDNYANALPILKKYNVPATIFVSTGFIGKENITSDGVSMSILDKNMILNMLEDKLIEFMPHGHNHDKLAKISLEDAKKDILKSKEELEKLIEKKVYCFAYPYGSYSNDVVDFLRLVGFIGAVTTDEGVVSLQADTFLLPRMAVDSKTSFGEFKFKIMKSKLYLYFKNIFK